MAVNYRRIVIILAALLLSLGGLALSASLAQAAPAAPIDIPMTQPDGSVITVRQWGDEWQHGYEAKDGHTILKDSASGFWVYAARQGDGSLAPARSASQKMLVVGRDNPGSLAQHVRPEETSLQKQQRSSALQSSPSGPSLSPNQGTQKVLLLLVEFDDWGNYFPESDFQKRIFGSGDSVKSFYNQASFGQLNLQPAAESYGTANDGVIGWITLHRSHPTITEEAPKVVNDALIAANSYINFASFDSPANGGNGDKYLSNTELHIIVLLAGYETSYGGVPIGAATIWAHRWTLNGMSYYGENYDPILDGVHIGQERADGGYAMFGEIHYDHAATMGVIAHELGHDLSWPDLYDISQDTDGVGAWSIMGYGSWNYINLPGDKPALPDAWLKYYQGWLSPRPMYTTTSYNLLTAATYASAVILGTNPGGVDWNFQKKSGKGEYFLVENRQLAGFDTALPGCGILIWHINETTSLWNDANAPSESKLPPLVALVPADNLKDLFIISDGNQGDDGDPFPGSTNNHLFSDATLPNSLLYNGNPTGHNLTINASECSSSMKVSYVNPNLKYYRVFMPIAQ